MCGGMVHDHIRSVVMRVCSGCEGVFVPDINDSSYVRTGDNNKYACCQQRAVSKYTTYTGESDCREIINRKSESACIRVLLGVMNHRKKNAPVCTAYIACTAFVFHLMSV